MDLLNSEFFPGRIAHQKQRNVTSVTEWSKLNVSIDVKITLLGF